MEKQSQIQDVLEAGTRFIEEINMGMNEYRIKDNAYFCLFELLDR